MIPRSPLSALDGERLPGIGHNLGPPLDGGLSWRRFAWKKARAQLVPRLPLEVVRRRVKRATELGLEYPQYASILLGTGRDVIGFLYTCDALGLRLARTGRLEPGVAAKLGELKDCGRLLATEEPDEPLAAVQAIAHAHGIEFDGSARLPHAGALWRAGRDAIRAALARLKLPADGVVMVGTRPHHRLWADAARMAKFLPAEKYF